MKGRGEKKFVVIPFFRAINFTKLNYFIFEMLKKKIWANFHRIIELFTQKIVTKRSKIWVWDPESRIRKKPIPDPRSRGQKGIRYQIRNTDFYWAIAGHQTYLRRSLNLFEKRGNQGYLLI
jgi:hypothetical protein